MALFDWISSRFSKPTQGASDGAAPVPSTEVVGQADRLIEEGNQQEDSGRYERAEELYREALKIYPDYPRAYVNLGNVLAAMGRTDEAEACYREVLRIRPDFGKAYFNLGRLLSLAGELEESIGAYRDSVRCLPEFTDARIALAAALVEYGQLNAGISEYRVALEQQPDNGAAHYGLGVALFGRGETLRALDHVLTAAEDPQTVPVVYEWFGQTLDEAIAGNDFAYLQAVRSISGFPDLRVILGRALERRGQEAEALVEYRSALADVPSHGLAHLNLGGLLYRQGEVLAALDHLRRTLEDPRAVAGAHSWLGRIAGETANPHDAVSHFRQASQLMPDDPSQYSAYLFCANFLPEVDGESLLAEHREFPRRYLAAATVAAKHSNEPNAERILRVGYVSGDFCSHSVARFMEPILEAHRRNRVAVFCYSCGLTDDDATQRLRQRADHWRYIARVDDDETCAIIAADGIDILVDLAGHKCLAESQLVL